MDLNGTNQQVAGLIGVAGTFVTTETGTLTVTNKVANVYGGTITAGSGGGLTVNGGSRLFDRRRQLDDHPGSDAGQPQHRCRVDARGNARRDDASPAVR